jgi:hypothetical membrane protein
MVLWGKLCILFTHLEYLLTLLGIATIGQGLVKSFEGLVAMRVLVGIFEAGLFPYVPVSDWHFFPCGRGLGLTDVVAVVVSI